MGLTRIHAGGFSAVTGSFAVVRTRVVAERWRYIGSGRETWLKYKLSRCCRIAGWVNGGAGRIAVNRLSVNGGLNVANMTGLPTACSLQRSLAT